MTVIAVLDCSSYILFNVHMSVNHHKWNDASRESLKDVSRLYIRYIQYTLLIFYNISVFPLNSHKNKNEFTNIKTAKKERKPKCIISTYATFFMFFSHFLMLYITIIFRLKSSWTALLLLLLLLYISIMISSFLLTWGKLGKPNFDHISN